MENQYPSQFPFDPFDAADELGAADIFPPASSMTRGAGSTEDLRALRARLEALSGELRRIVELIDRALVTPVPASRRPVEAHTAAPPRSEAMIDGRAMSYTRSADPIPSSITREDASLLRVIEGVFDGQ
ncbi:MAG: hypothetical protein Q8R16_00340, partial [bacterium]|nr:hypothetical protein [bacterium]